MGALPAHCFPPPSCTLRPPFRSVLPTPHFALPSHCCFLPLWMAPTQPHTFITCPPPVLSPSLLFPFSASVSLSHDFLWNTSSARSILKPSALLLLYTSALSVKSRKNKLRPAGDLGAPDCGQTACTASTTSSPNCRAPCRAEIVSSTQQTRQVKEITGVYSGQAGEKFQHLLVNVIFVPPRHPHSTSHPSHGQAREDGWPCCEVLLSCHHSQRLLHSCSGQQGTEQEKVLLPSRHGFHSNPTTVAVLEDVPTH